MATRSMIGKRLKDGSVIAIYCHWDGYPSYNGSLLLKHYNTPKKIDKLIALGSLSCLGKTLNSKDTKAHCRDMQRELSIEKYTSEKAFYKTQSLFIEYAYLWKDNRWYVNKELLIPKMVEE